jgi:hypothetical protein
MTLPRHRQLQLAARNEALMERWLEDRTASYVKLGKEFGISRSQAKVIIVRYCRAHPELQDRVKPRLENSQIQWRWEDINGRWEI